MKHFDHQVLRCLLNEIDRGHGFRLVDIQLPLTQNDIFDALRRRIGTYKKSICYLSVILAFTFQLLRDSGIRGAVIAAVQKMHQLLEGASWFSFDCSPVLHSERERGAEVLEFHSDFGSGRGGCVGFLYVCRRTERDCSLGLVHIFMIGAMLPQP